MNHKTFSKKGGSAKTKEKRKAAQMNLAIARKSRWKSQKESKITQVLPQAE